MHTSEQLHNVYLAAGQRADNTSNSGRPEQNAEGPTRTTGDQNTPHQNHSQQQEAEGTTLRSRVPHNTQPNTERGSSGTGEGGEELLPIQLVLSTTRLSIRVPPTTSLGELRRFEREREGEGRGEGGGREGGRRERGRKEGDSKEVVCEAAKY